MKSEHSEQVLLINWVRKNQKKDPRLCVLFAIPNGGTRNMATATRLKHEGVLSGVPDLFLPVSSGGYHGLFIELKTLKGRPTTNQKRFIDMVRSYGYQAEICRGHEEAINVIQEYLN